MSIISLLFTASTALACKPVAGFKPPTLAQNFREAPKVFFALIEKKTPTEKVFQFQVKIERSWKGTEEPTLTVTTNPTSTCDPFGFAEVGDACVFLVDKNNRVISGITTGQSSVCALKDSRRAQNLRAEYDKEFKALKK